MKLRTLAYLIGFGFLSAVSLFTTEEFFRTKPAYARPQSPRKIGCALSEALTAEEFNAVMQAVAEAWNQGNAEAAASCFTEDAIYSGPPSAGHHGRKSLYEFFGGAKGRELPMHMEWHNLIFDAARQIGGASTLFSIAFKLMDS